MRGNYFSRFAAVSLLVWAGYGCKPSAPAVDQTIGANLCANNIAVLANGKKMWAEQNHKGANDVPTMDELMAFVRRPPNCPGHGTYTLGKVSETPTCSIPEHNEAYKKLTAGNPQ